MRYFHYGSIQDDAVRQTYTNTVELKGRGDNKLGILAKEVGSVSIGSWTDISYVQTTIKQGTWGWVPAKKNSSPTAVPDSGPGKVAGLLCVDQRGSYSNTKTYWYQIGVDSHGKAFAELGWRTWWGAGSILGEYKKIAVADNMVLKMVPKGNVVEFHFGSHVEKLTWDPTSNDWNTGDLNPKFKDNKDNYWNDMNKIISIRLQIEAYWSSSSASSEGKKMELPGTESDPVVFGPTKYESRGKGTKTISGDKFIPPRYHDNNPNFEYSSKDNQGRESNIVKLWSSKNSESKEQN